MLKLLKSVKNRIHKGIRDIGSGAKDIARNNPEALALAAFIGMGGLPGGQPFLGGNIGLPSFLQKGSTIRDLIGNISGQSSTTLPGTSGIIPGSGILGLGEKAGKFLGKEGIVSLITSYLAKKQFDEEAEAARLEKEEALRRANLVSDSFGSPFGGSPFLEGKVEDLVYDPETGKTYDYYDDETETFKNYQVDDEGRVISNAQGGIAQLNVGGNPRNRMSFRLPVRRAYGGNMNGSSGINPQIFDPRMSGKQMMKQIENNPGITEFFPPKFGMIEGPGGPKDDKIPAMLSDGEFVMTAKAVDNAGGPKAMYGLMNALDPESSKGRGIV